MQKIVKNMSTHEEFFQFDELDGNKNKILWENIVKVMIETNDSGPLGNDLNLILSTAKEDIHIAMDLDGTEDLIKFLQIYLPDFNDNEFMRAMLSVDNASFNIWNK